MELLALFAIGAVWYYLANNKQVNREVTKERIVQKFKTDDGYVERETVRTFESDITEFKKSGYVAQPTLPNSNRASSPTSEFTSERVIKAPQMQPVIIEYDQPINHNSLPPYLVDSHANQMLISNENNLQTKRCPHCNRLQPLSEFRPNKNTADGLTKWCSSCMAEPQKKQTGLRKCPKCKQMRRIESFGESPTNPDGLHKWCKFCHKK